MKETNDDNKGMEETNKKDISSKREREREKKNEEKREVTKER